MTTKQQHKSRATVSRGRFRSEQTIYQYTNIPIYQYTNIPIYQLLKWELNKNMNTQEAAQVFQPEAMKLYSPRIANCTLKPLDLALPHRTSALHSMRDQFHILYTIIGGACSVESLILRGGCERLILSSSDVVFLQLAPGASIRRFAQTTTHRTRGEIHSCNRRRCCFHCADQTT